MPSQFKAREVCGNVYDISGRGKIILLAVH